MFSGGTAGVYEIDLAYTPANTSFAAIVTPINDGVMCAATEQYASSTKAIVVKCKLHDNTAANASFSFVVFDDT